MCEYMVYILYVYIASLVRQNNTENNNIGYWFRHIYFNFRSHEVNFTVSKF